MRLLWVHRLTGDDAGGDMIVDTKLVAQLRRRHDVTMLGARRIPRRAQIARAAAHLSMPDMFGFGDKQTVAAIVAALADKPDAIVFSHEHLDRVAELVKPHANGAALVTLRHNITSDAMGAILDEHKLLAAVWAARARLQERRALTGTLFDAIAVISQRDKTLVEAISGRRDVVVTLPGAPPAAALSSEAQVRDELVLLGTYGWFPKAKDLRRFAAEYAALPARPSAFYAEAALDGALASALRAQPLTAQYSEAIRFGLITDRFAAGHKLKTSAYLMNNCAVLSFTPVADDFAFAPHAARFIRQISHAGEIAPIIKEFQATPIETLRAELTALKASLAETLSWSNQAALLEQVLADAAITARSRAGLDGLRPLTMQSA